MTRFHPFSGKPVQPRSRRTVTAPEADTVARNRHLGWEAGSVEGADDMGREASREAFWSGVENQLIYVAAQQRLLRHAHDRGMVLGAAAAAIVFAAGILLRFAIDAYWPVACDGTGGLIDCGLRMIGVAT